jgi:glycosyltransferase involved in cell wall biosynthesis
MRISFISPTVNMAGGTRVMVIHAQQLVRKGHTVRIISPPPAPVPVFQRVRSWIRGDEWTRSTQVTQSHLDGSGIDHHVLDRWRPVRDDDVPDGDVVIATWWETAEWVHALAREKGAKAYFVQGHEIFPFLPVARCHATYRLPMHKIVVSQWLKTAMASQYNDRVVDLVPNSVDRAQFFASVRGKQRVPTVGFLAATATFKGFDVTIAALETVREALPDLQMISFGTGKPGRESKLPKGTQFFLSPAQGELRSLYSQCDVWVTASRSEGFNLPAMEAMACRTPVVSTRTGWPEEAIKSGENGVLVDVDDRAGLAEAIKWVLSLEDQEWRKLSSNAYATVCSSSWQKSSELFERALEHACWRSARGEIAGGSGPSDALLPGGQWTHG